jgi:anaerobic selenocysteine-containing dehydrogenase
MALELQMNGFQTIRAIAILQAITGNLDISGGALATEDFKLESISIPYEKEIKAIGQNEFPLFHKFTGHSQSNMYFKAILESNPYSIESMIVVGSNPLLAWPYTNKVRKALESINFLVVIDNFMTASAQLADIVLPAATFLSQNELWVASSESGELVVGLAPKGCEEEGCLSDWLVWNRLAKEMGYDDFFPWEDDEKALNERLQPLGLNTDILKQLPNGFVFGNRTYKKYLKSGFPTESGKVEIYSSILQQYGYDPLPIFRKEFESNTNDFPLTLSFGTRSIGYRQSNSGKTKAEKKKSHVPLLEMHPDKADELGLAEGDSVIVESSRSSIEISIAFNDEIEPGVVFIPHGWDEANANILTGDRNLDPITGFPVDRCLAVRVRKK